MARFGVNVVPEIPSEGVSQSSDPDIVGSPPSKFRSSYLLAAYAFAVAVTPEFNFLGIPKVRFTDLLLPFMFLSYLESIRDRGTSGRASPLATICYRLLLWDFGALLLWGQAPLTPGFFYLGKRVIYMLVALFASGCVRSLSAWRTVVRILVFSTPILNFFVLRELKMMQSMGGIYATSDGMRASGIIARQETSTALFIVIVCCLTLGAWDAFKDSTWRIATWTSLLTGCAAIFATGSRGGLACIALSLVVFCALNPQKIRNVLVVGVVVGVAAWTFTPGAVRSRLAALFPETEATYSGLMTDEKLLPTFGSSSVADRVLTAQWFFHDIMPQSGFTGLGAGWKGLGAIDNFYLTEWMYHGFIGLCLFLQLQLALLRYCLRAAREARDPAEKGVASGVATALIVMSASCIHAETFYLIRPMECLALLVGLVAARRSIRS